MLSKELTEIARSIEDTGRLKASKPVDLKALSARLHAIAEGVSCLEAVTVPASAHVLAGLMPKTAPDPASASDHVEALIASGREARSRVTILHTGPMRDDERMARQLVGQPS